MNIILSRQEFTNRLLQATCMTILTSSPNTLQFRPASSPYFGSKIELYVDCRLLSVEVKAGEMSADILVFMADIYAQAAVALLSTGDITYFLALQKLFQVLDRLVLKTVQSALGYLASKAALTSASELFFSNTAQVSKHPTQPGSLDEKLAQDELVTLEPLAILHATQGGVWSTLGIQLSCVNPGAEHAKLLAFDILYKYLASSEEEEMSRVLAL